MSDSIHQEVAIDASAHRIFEALTSAEQFSGFTGDAPSEIDATAGGAFTCFGGMITGRNIELVPGGRVVQAWRVKNWSDGTYSIVRFELEAKGTSTQLVFDQSGHPATAQQELEGGWHKMYWEPLRKYLA